MCDVCKYLHLGRIDFLIFFFVCVCELMIVNCFHRNRVMLSHNMFSHILTDPGPLSEMPKGYLMEMAANR